MASGFCLRVLLLSLISYGQLTLGNVHRYQGRNFRPYAEQAEMSPRSSNPIPRRYDSFVHPRAAVASSNVPEGFKPLDSVGGQVDSYSHKGSVPSYNPASSPSQVSQSSYYQRKPDAWHPESSKGARKGSNIVSSGAIVIQAEKSPQQESGSSNSDLQSKTSVPSSTYSAGQQPQKQLVQKAGMRDSAFASNAQSPGRFPAARPSLQLPVSGPAVLQSKAGMQDSMYASGVTSPGMYPSSKLPQMPVTPEPPRQQSKATWKTVSPSNLNYPWTYFNTWPSKKSPASSAALKSKAGMRDNLYAPSAQSQGVYSSAQPGQKNPAFSAPAVLQTKEGMWDSLYAPSAPSQEMYSSAQPAWKHPPFSAPAVLQTKEGMWDSLYAPSAQSQMYSSVHPAFSAPVPQGMWGSELASGAKSDPIEHDDITPRGYRPAPLREYFPINWHRPQWMPKLNLPGSLPSLSSLPFNVFQNRAGMLDADMAQVAQVPRLSRPVPGSSLRYEGLQPQRALAQRNLASTQGNRRPLVS